MPEGAADQESAPIRPVDAPVEPASVRDGGEAALARMLRNALGSAEEADAVLERANAIRQDAETYRAEVGAEIIRSTEKLSDELRAKADTARREAADLLQSADKARATAQRTLRDAETIRHNAERRASSILAHARQEAEEFTENTRSAARQAVESDRTAASESITVALANIEKIKRATESEKEAQKLYGQAVQIRRAAPSPREVRLASADAERS